jgi:hypothetical protein
MDRGGGATPIKLLAHACNLAKRVTMDRKGNIGAGPHPGCFTVTKHGNMWANIKRSGHANEFHSHPGGYWPCVYYFEDEASKPIPNWAANSNSWDRMGIEHRLAVAADRSRRHRPRRPVGLRPLHHRRCHNPKPRRYRPTTVAGTDRCNDMLTQVIRERTHRCWPPSHHRA